MYYKHIKYRIYAHSESRGLLAKWSVFIFLIQSYKEHELVFAGVSQTGSMLEYNLTVNILALLLKKH